MYCGDETGAFIGDIGSHTARFGYGGEDCPKLVIPSAVYKHSSDENNNGQDNQKQLGGKKRGAQERGKYTAPVSLMNLPPQSCFSFEGDDEDSDVGFIPIYQSMNSNNNQKKQTAQDSCDGDGVIQDIDAWACMWEYSFSAMTARGKSKHTVGYKKKEQSLDGPIDHPLLAVDSSSRIVSTKLQEKQKALMLETLFESLSAPAAYIAPSAMLSSFANGRQTSLIVDVGHTGSRVYSFSAMTARGKSKHTVGYKKKEQSLDGPIDHPLLAVDSSSRIVSTKLQEKQKALMLETLFESLSAPAAYIAPSAMLSSFANGRQTSLIVDVGHTGSRVTPVVDGYLLHSGSCKSGRGGMWLGDVQRGVLEGCWKVNGSDNVMNKWNGWQGIPPCQFDGVIPRYILHSNTKQKLKATELEQLKRSPFHSMAVHEVMNEMMTSTSLQSFGMSSATSTPFVGYGSFENNIDVAMEDKNDNDDDDDDDGPSYVLPDGTKIDLAQPVGKDLCRLPQLLLSDELPSLIQPQTSDANDYASNMLPLQKLVHISLSQILDADLRKELASNIILTGSASLFPGLDKNLSIELGKVLPATYKHKVISSRSTVENRYGAWIGGSILSSLGSFQQLWLSKKEYEENGAVLGLQRFNNN